ncbi:MAG: MaoC family dehydratase [Geminicoccaceae bacterium]
MQVASSKTSVGRFFEDFQVGQEFLHPTPRTVTQGDVALYIALTGSRYAQYCGDGFARQNGLPRAPVHDLLAFHMVFGKSVPDISLNAVANLGYAEGKFAAFVYPGDTLSARSRVIGLKENSTGDTGTVWVRTRGFKGDMVVVDFVRWVMVRKRDPESPAPTTVTPSLQPALAIADLPVPPGLRPRRHDMGQSGSPYWWEHYSVGEKIDHLDGMTVEESEHRLATRLYQNTARVHFDSFAEKAGRFGRTIVYGGHVLSVANALAFNGLGNMLHMAAINGGTHVNPCFAGDTIYAWSEVLDAQPVPGHGDLGALRLRLVAVKNQTAADFPLRGGEGQYLPGVLLDFDYWALFPKKR